MRDAEASPPSRERWIRILGGFAIGAACLALQWWIKAQDDGLGGGELVRELQHGGHTYELYFHRGGKYFNTIRKDGELVFDSRTDERLRGCIHELIVIDGAVHRRCYLSEKKGVATQRIP